jgi:tight adherence protein C
MVLVAVFGAAAVIGSLFVAWWAVSGTSSRVDLGANEGEPADLRSRYLDQGASTRVASPIIESFGSLVRRWSPAGRVKQLETKLARAGFPSGWSVERVLAFKVLLALLLGAAVWLLFLDDMSAFGLLMIIAAAAIGFFIPDSILNNRADHRKLSVRSELSDVIDQMSMMVRAGLGIDAAISRTARSSTGPLSEEFTRVGHDIRMGVDRSVALANMADRVDVPELNSLVAALNQAERLGVPVSQTLEIQAGELRLKRRQLAEEQAMKLPVKILFPLVFCIFPVLMIVVLGPAVISVFEAF